MSEDDWPEKEYCGDCWMCYSTPCEAVKLRRVMEVIFKRAREEKRLTKDRKDYTLQELQKHDGCGILPVCVTRSVIEEFGSEEEVAAMQQMMDVR